jgi:DNA-binding HxlR family transcriptional regulator
VAAQRRIRERMPIDPTLLRVVADPMRSFIVYSLVGAAKSAKQLAAELGCPPTRLYYHLQQLEKHGLIFVERTRKVSGIQEKHYRASARSFVVDRAPEGAAGQNDQARSQALLGFVFDQTRLDISHGLLSGRIDTGKLPTEAGALMAYRSVLKLDPAQAQGLYDRLLGVYRDYEALAKTPAVAGDYYALVASVYPTQQQHPQPGLKPRMRARTAE